MKRMLSFANRTMKEILRDPLTMGFGLGFPVLLLLLLSLIQANIPVCCLSSAAVPTARRLPSLITPILSESSSASSM